MRPEPRCQRTRELVPELALGIAEGRERAAALEHIASCPDCRLLLEEQAELADELLLLAPAHEPPPGFESRVLDQLAPRRARPSRLRPRLALAAVALTAATVAAGGTLLTQRDDRELASQYRAALDRVGGEYFEAAQLRAPDGTPAGKVFGYQGRPSWLLVVVYRDFREASLSAELVTPMGRRVAIPALDVENGSWGGAIALPLRQVALVRLSRDDGTVLEALLPLPDEG
jgi:hypothetical protein